MKKGHAAELSGHILLFIYANKPVDDLPMLLLNATYGCEFSFVYVYVFSMIKLNIR